MSKLTQYGYVKEGKLHILNRKRFEAELKEFKDSDVEVIVKTKGRRSLPSNAFYWGCVIPEIRQEFKGRGIRMTGEEIHEFLKLHFNKTYLYDDSGEVLAEIGGSTAAMNQTEFGDYLERIIQWCGEKLEIIIPEPSKQAEISWR